jgi:hypothetical protein
MSIANGTYDESSENRLAGGNFSADRETCRGRRGFISLSPVASG